MGGGSIVDGGLQLLGLTPGNTNGAKQPGPVAAGLDPRRRQRLRGRQMRGPRRRRRMPPAAAPAGWASLLHGAGEQVAGLDASRPVAPGAEEGWASRLKARALNVRVGPGKEARAATPANALIASSPPRWPCCATSCCARGSAPIPPSRSWPPPRPAARPPRQVASGNCGTCSPSGMAPWPRRAAGWPGPRAAIADDRGRLAGASAVRSSARRMPRSASPGSAAAAVARAAGPDL